MTLVRHGIVLSRQGKVFTATEGCPQTGGKRLWKADDQEPMETTY